MTATIDPPVAKTVLQPLIISRVFRAPRERVWSAILEWTKSHRIRQILRAATA